MRVLLGLALALAVAASAGCTPHLPAKEGFGTSALVAAGDIPPEFAEFNNYDPAVNTLLADQICATPYQLSEEIAVGASSGRLVQAVGRCRNHIPFFGNDPFFRP
jgi:hypothetical protein